MRPIGFSTGALALGDFHRALQMLRKKNTDALELSALRESELGPLISALPFLDLDGFKHISFHAPSYMSAGFEPIAVKLLERVAERGWLVIVHPDVMTDRQLWKRLGVCLCLENMDKRKPIGQTTSQLAAMFEYFSEASFCFDLGHARQVDPTMTEAFQIVRTFGDRLRQLHISEVNSESRHSDLTAEAVLAFRKLAPAIPCTVPAIIESRVSASHIEGEIQLVRQILDGERISQLDALTGLTSAFSD